MVDKADKERKLRQVFAEVELSRRQIEELSRQLQLAEARIVELNTAMVALEELKEKGEGKEVLVPVGADVFVRAQLKNVKHVIVGVGADVSVEEGVAGAESILKEKAEKMSAAMKKLQEAIGGINDRLVQLDAVSQQMMQGVQ